MARELLKGALILVLGALITWGLAAALQERATMADSAAAEKNVADFKPPPTRPRF